MNVTSKDAIITFFHPSMGDPITLTGFAKDLIIQFTEYDDVAVDIGADGETIAWSQNVYPEGKITFQPNSRTNPFLETIQTIQKLGLVQAGTLSLNVPATRTIYVLDQVVIKSGIQPPNLEARIMDKSFNFHYIPKSPVRY